MKFIDEREKMAVTRRAGSRDVVERRLSDDRGREESETIDQRLLSDYLAVEMIDHRLRQSLGLVLHGYRASIEIVWIRLAAAGGQFRMIFQVFRQQLAAPG